MSARGEWLRHPLTREFKGKVALAGAQCEGRLAAASRSGSMENIRALRASLDMLGSVHAMLEEDEDGEE